MISLNIFSRFQYTSFSLNNNVKVTGRESSPINVSLSSFFYVTYVCFCNLARL